jgi:hypothetical protein
MARPEGSKNNPNRRPMPFKQSEVARVVRAVESRGLNVRRVDVEPRTGKISILTGSDKDAASDNPWDEVMRGKNAQDKKRPA